MKQTLEGDCSITAVLTHHNTSMYMHNLCCIAILVNQGRCNEMSTGKCSGTCQHKIKFALTFSKIYLTLVEARVRNREVKVNPKVATQKIADLQLLICIKHECTLFDHADITIKFSVTTISYML